MAYINSPLVTALFWLVILASLVAAAWWILRASALGGQSENDRADLDVYADQVAEIDKDLLQGRIDAEAASAARLEIGRRLVKAKNRDLLQGRRLNRAVLGMMAAGIAFLAGGLYVVAGSPSRADMPFQARERELLSRDPATLTGDEIMMLLQERARLNPDDPKPHALMGQMLMSTGRNQDALRAYQAVLRRTPNDAEAIAEAGGILMRLNDNKLGDDAKSALNAALKIDPKSPSALYYLALADWQNGKKDVAFSTWQRAFGAIGDKPEAQALLAARVAQTVSALDRGPDARNGPIGGSSDRSAAGPMATKSNADQAAFIKTMIAARQARLAANPSDIALRLSVVRVLVMSDQSETARAVLLEGLERANDQPFTTALYEVAARSLVMPVGPSPQAPNSVTKR